MLAGVVGTLLLTYLSFQDFSTLMRNQTQLRYLINPLNSLYALAEVVLLPAQIDQHIQVLGDDARILPLPVKGAHPTGDHTQPWGKQPPLLVIALGETARSANFSLNGYDRNTNPALSQQDVLSYRQVTSCGSTTSRAARACATALNRCAPANCRCLRLARKENAVMTCCCRCSSLN
jgi:lipid A ethanolaminephosphotransferase